MISRGIAELDDMISTCMQLDDELLEKLNHKFEKDRYVDWAKEQSGLKHQGSGKQLETMRGGDIEEILKYKLLWTMDCKYTVKGDYTIWKIKQTAISEWNKGNEEKLCC